MSFFLWSALLIAALSVFGSGGVLLLGIFGLDPLAISDARQVGHLANVSELSAAISGIFALMVGAIAIIAVIVADRAETRAVEQLKVDIASLWMALHSLRNRALLYTNPALVRADLDLFEEERRTMQGVLNGPTGFAIYDWQAAHESRGFRHFTSDLAGLINLTTLKVDAKAPGQFLSIATRSNNTTDLLATLSDADIRTMGRRLGKLGSGLTSVTAVSSKDEISQFLSSVQRESRASLPVPSEADVEAAAAAAKRLIGDNAGDQVMHFGRQALAGGPDDVWTYHQLVQQLGVADPASQ